MEVTLPPTLLPPGCSGSRPQGYGICRTAYRVDPIMLAWYFESKLYFLYKNISSEILAYLVNDVE